MKVCPLLSGSSGNATFVASGATRLLVDCGASRSAIAKQLEAIGERLDGINAVLITHAHDDHVRGLDVVAKTLDAPVYASVGVWEELFRRNKTPRVAARNIKVFQSAKTSSPIEIKDLTVRFFSTPHDAQDSVGYVFDDGKSTFGLATDLGRVTPGVRAALVGLDVVLLEANYDEEMLANGPYPYPLKERIRGAYGHLCNDASGEFAVELARGGVKHLFLGHLSVHNNTQKLAYGAVERALLGAGVKPGEDCMVYMTRRYEASRNLEF